MTNYKEGDFDRDSTMADIYAYYEDLFYYGDLDDEENDRNYEYLRELNIMPDEAVINEAVDCGLDVRYKRGGDCDRRYA
jgi:hypothetical protein